MSDVHAPSFLEPVPKTATIIKLPSAGVPYKEGSAEGSGKLTLNAMTMVEEAAILNPAKGVTFSQAVDKVLQKAIQEPINVNNLLSADKFYLFMMLRAVTYGQNYSFIWECANKDEEGETCDHENTSSVNIPGDFKTKVLLPEDKEPYAVTLPITGKKIMFRLSRGVDEIEIDNYEAEIKAKQKAGVMIADTTAIFRLAKLITHVDDNEITQDIATQHLVSFVNSLPAEDIAMLRDQMEHFTPGLDTTVKVVCTECRELTEMDLPITVSFFRPNYSVRGEPEKIKIRHDVLHGDELPGDNEDGSVGTPVVSREIEGNKGGGDGARTS